MEATDGFYIQMPSQTNSTNFLVGEITYLQIRCAIKRSRILNRPFANKQQEQTKIERIKIPHNFVGAGALDSPLYINVFSGRRRRRPYRCIEKPFFSSPPRGCANNETDSEATCCTDALSLQFITICGAPPKFLFVPFV